MFLFRADGNSRIGSGHVMRCLSIADAANRAGEKCVFVTASDDMSGLIRARRQESRILGTDYRRMEEEGILSVVEACRPSMVIVDSYFVTEKYLYELKDWCGKAGSRLVYIDDRKAFPYPCHVLLNYNIYGAEADYRELYRDTPLPELMVGTEYAPLRREFLEAGAREVKTEARDVFVSTGGADSRHLSLELMKALDFKTPKSGGLTFHFVVGSMNPDKEALRELAEKKNVRLYENVTEMAKLMASCDIAISAAGSTLYELCATRTPTVTYVLEDNQAPIAGGFSSRGIMENCGDIRDLGGERLAARLIESAERLADDFRERCRISCKMKSLADGRGAERIVERLL
ncbi:MAG: UDP-2,4-diacetamido-2,4,6-trideoxy-beta-L-altropyranose hydrolase [Roseburia sp.]|nr:UDP-2,4-diacetamido-2,4,6-trideoxy-beta-L-altropyranose hydrolase [Roseburia sp.]MCM1098157.1 UDP-2,4-diacetamido-2,4,6-trideoxy-beta-L-altropyranose hydrolase [Ruminococcus flavefaciens]